ncbi:hypothetical protein LLG39_03995, partial [bacterium]|nr:hypothetical protein [bacterium]
GKSEASLRSYKDARQRGANVICVASGGALLEAASKDGIKAFKIPPGHPARSAIGYLFVPLVVVLEQFGLVTGLVDQLTYGIRLMKNIRETFRFDVSQTRNVAKQVALAVAGKAAVIYGASDYRAVVAERWRSQLNANSKSEAFTDIFPDVVDGAISGWELAEKQCANVAFVFFRDSQDRSEVPDLMDASREVLAGFSSVDVELKGSTVIEKLLYGVYMGDYVSCYLALINEVDPGITENVNQVQARIQQEELPEE